LPLPAAEPAREEPKPAAPAPTTTATPIARAAVDFPPAAAARNIDAGTVKARLTIDANGAVKNVQILESRPRRYFDEEATRSLREWRFNPGADNRSYEVQIDFQR
jgi:TonB family protein